MRIERSTVINCPRPDVWRRIEARAGGRLEDFGDYLPAGQAGLLAPGLGDEAPERPQVVVRRDQRVDLRLPGGLLPFRMLARLDAAGEGTKTTLVIELTLPLLLRPLSPFVSWFLGRELATELRRLKKDAEAEF